MPSPALVIGVAFAYLTNRPGKRFENDRADAVIASVYAALGATP